MWEFLRKHSFHGENAASVLLKLFINQLRKHSLHGENSSLSFIETVHQSTEEAQLAWGFMQGFIEVVY